MHYDIDTQIFIDTGMLAQLTNKFAEHFNIFCVFIT